LSIPPPLLAEPPVIPIARILTVAPEATVTTGPPPLMIVVVGPAPDRVTFVEIVNPPV